MRIGIDLGTTSALAAYDAGDGPRILPNRLGERLTPLAVCADGRDLLAGRPALERMEARPERGARFFQRDLGSRKLFSLGGRSFTAEELSALVLRSLREDAKALLGEAAAEAWIAVPACFGKIRKDAVRRAGEQAGFRSVRIVSEPTAAAAAYGLFGRPEKDRFLVFDLGGKSFDLSLLERADRGVCVRTVAGDRFLGGEDFTQRILDAFLERHGIGEKELTEAEYAYLRNRAEECKLAPGRGEYFRMQALLKGERAEMLLPRGEFLERSDRLFGRIEQAVRRGLSDAGIRPCEIDEVILNGGAAKLPAVRRFAARLFGRVPDMSLPPDETVALGAAALAAGQEEPFHETVYTDICPFTLGVSLAVPGDREEAEGNRYYPVLERGTALPASRTLRFFAAHGQRSACVRILEGESRFASQNVALEALTLALPESGAGREEISVTVTCDGSGLLEAEARAASTGETEGRFLKLLENEMTEETMRAKMQALACLKIPPREREENRILLLRGARLYEEATGELREQLETVTRQFERILDRQDPEQIEEARTDYEDLLAWIEDELRT